MKPHRSRLRVDRFAKPADAKRREKYSSKAMLPCDGVIGGLQGNEGLSESVGESTKKTVVQFDLIQKSLSIIDCILKIFVSLKHLFDCKLVPC